MFLAVRAALRSELKLIPTALRWPVAHAIASSSARGTSPPRLTIFRPLAEASGHEQRTRRRRPTAPASRTVAAREGPPRTNKGLSLPATPNATVVARLVGY